MPRPSIIVHGFKIVKEKDPKTGLRTRPVEYVIFSPAHSAMFTTIEERVDWLKPAQSYDGDDTGMKLAFMRNRWAQIEPHYIAWKEGRELPLDGIALVSWGAVDDEQIKEFQKHGKRSVQDVAEMTDSEIQRIQLPGVRTLRDEARLFIENTDKAALANTVAEQQAKMDAMSEQMAAMQALLEEKTKPGKKEAA